MTPVPMTPYDAEQAEAYGAALSGLTALGPEGRGRLREAAAPYLSFRERVRAFQAARVDSHCAAACFATGLSACCTREGILTYFADAVVNALVSTPEEIRLVLSRLGRDPADGKCVYLSSAGCTWKLVPIVCAMFLCDAAEEKLARDGAAEEWQALKAGQKAFTFPDRPVLFDELEKTFLALGRDAALMHLHKSPGLLRVKKMHGLL